MFLHDIALIEMGVSTLVKESNYYLSQMLENPLELGKYHRSTK